MDTGEPETVAGKFYPQHVENGAIDCGSVMDASFERRIKPMLERSI
jgi:hypothetical protein